LKDLDTLIGSTQRNITYVYIALFAGALAALLFLPRPLDESTKTLLITLLGILGTLITQQSNFWFARQRTAGVPDPSTTTTSTTTTTTPTPAIVQTTTTGAPPNETTTTIVTPADSDAAGRLRSTGNPDA
jgi:hypothetical protein